MPYRFGLLTREDRDAIANNTASLHDALMQRLYNPVLGPLATQLADDPFGWLEHFLSGLPLANSNLDLEDNMLVAHRGDLTSVLVVTTLPGSAYESQTQRTVLSAVALLSALTAGTAETYRRPAPGGVGIRDHGTADVADRLDDMTSRLNTLRDRRAHDRGRDKGR